MPENLENRELSIFLLKLQNFLDIIYDVYFHHGSRNIFWILIWLFSCCVSCTQLHSIFSFKSWFFQRPFSLWYQNHLVQVKDKRKTNLNLTSSYTQRWSYLSRILSMHVQKRKHWSSNLVDRLVYTLISEIPFLISVRPSKLLQRN